MKIIHLNILQFQLLQLQQPLVEEVEVQQLQLLQEQKILIRLKHIQYHQIMVIIIHL